MLIDPGVRIPRIAGLELMPAVNRLREFALTVEAVRPGRATSPPQIGKVVRTQPAIDTVVPSGTSVTIFIGQRGVIFNDLTRFRQELNPQIFQVVPNLRVLPGE